MVINAYSSLKKGDGMRATIFLVITISIFLFVLNCAPVNETQRSGRIPEVKEAKFKEQADKELGHLFEANPVLAEELKKLPELKRGLDERGLLALNRISKFYIQSPNSEEIKQIFNRILSIGKKERRKFSAPLQAFFWLAEESEIPPGENPLSTIPKKDYRVNKHLGEDEGVIMFVYNIWGKTYDTGKWKNTSEVIERLNSPHLFDIFFMENIAYDMPKHYRKSSDAKYYENWGSYLQSARVTIEKRKGVCADATNLADEILSKAGYNIKPLQVKFRGRDDPGMHMVGLLKERGLFYKIADNLKDGIVGPFKTIKEIAEKVAENHERIMEDYSSSQVPIR